MNSAPLIARPGMPSSLAIAAAVTAWSPVIMRTRIPASCAIAIAAFAAGRGGIDDPDQGEHRQPVEQRQQVGRTDRSVAGSKSFRPVAITRRPWLASRSFSSM